jgi:hypothetical protein
VKVINRTILLTIPCTGERNTNFIALLTNGGTVVAWDISASFFTPYSRLWLRLFSQMCLVSFPAGAPAGVPAPQPGYQGFRISFSLFPQRAGFTGKIFSGEGVWLIFIVVSFHD